jgi:hypothetical protein
MKPLASGALVKTGAVNATECLQYAMNLPTSVVITGCDTMDILNTAINAGKTFRPMDPRQVSALLAKTAQYAKNGEYERFKTTEAFDATSRHPEWL